jgi:hypothetical protein
MTNKIKVEIIFENVSEKNINEYLKESLETDFLDSAEKDEKILSIKIVK